MLKNSRQPAVGSSMHRFFEFLTAIANRGPATVYCRLPT